MAIVRLSTPLRKFSEGKPEINTEGSTLKEVLANIDSKIPGFLEKVVENDEIKQFINIYINNEDVRLGEGLSTALGESDVVSILPAVSGG
ncbi:MoaD/ThiS family protein [archaeon]|nr:MoaD/ThiS family protein [archaeon]